MLLDGPEFGVLDLVVVHKKLDSPRSYTLDFRQAGLTIEGFVFLVWQRLLGIRSKADLVVCNGE